MIVIVIKTGLNYMKQSIFWQQYNFVCMLLCIHLSSLNMKQVVVWVTAVMRTTNFWFNTSYLNLSRSNPCHQSKIIKKKGSKRRMIKWIKIFLLIVKMRRELQYTKEKWWAPDDYYHSVQHISHHYIWIAAISHPLCAWQEDSSTYFFCSYKNNAMHTKLKPDEIERTGSKLAWASLFHHKNQVITVDMMINST